MAGDTRIDVRAEIARLKETLTWARGIRADSTQSTIALQLADEVIVAVERLLEGEHVRQEQLDRFFGETACVTDLGTPH